MKMAQFLDNLTVDNPLIKTYIFYTSILAIKMVMMAGFTSINRIKTLTFASSEDLVFNKKANTGTNDQVERIRRAHLNDLENIPVFMIVSLLYVMTNPNAILAMLLFRAFTAARITHSYAYTIGKDLLTRGKTWAVGFIITAYMVINLIVTFVDSF